MTIEARVESQAVEFAREYYKETNSTENIHAFINRESAIPSKMSIKSAVNYIKRHFPEIKMSKKSIAESLKNDISDCDTASIGYQTSGKYRTTGLSGYGSRNYSLYSTKDINEWIKNKI